VQGHRPEAVDTPQGVLGTNRCLASRPSECGDTTTCRMTGVTLHSHVRYKENVCFERPSGALPPDRVWTTGERGSC